jgi:hypothetical protein
MVHHNRLGVNRLGVMTADERLAKIGGLAA